jgi:hypothetical protein
VSRADLEKLKSVNLGGRTRGRSRVTELTDDATGRTTGFEIDHGDRQEAIVRPGLIKAHMSMGTGEVTVDG